MAKFKTNSLISGIIWGIVIHVGINVILPQIKNINLSNIFQVGATPEPTPTPTTPTVPEEEPMEPEDPETPLEDEPMEEEEEEEEYEEGGEEGEGEGEVAAGEDEEYEEDPTAAGARSTRGGGAFGSRRGGSNTIMAERARMRSMLARRYWR